MPRSIASKVLNSLANLVGLGSSEKDEIDNENRTDPLFVTSSLSSTTSLEIADDHIRDNALLGFSNAVGPCASVGIEHQISLEDAVVNDPFRGDTDSGFSNAVGLCPFVGTDQILQVIVDRDLRRSKRKHSVVIYGTVPKKFKFFEAFDTSIQARVHWADAPSHRYNDLSLKDFDKLGIPESACDRAKEIFGEDGNDGEYTKLVGERTSFRTRIRNTYFSPDQYCLLYGVFNVVQVPVYEKTLKKAIELFGSTHGSLQMLANAVNPLGIQIQAIEELGCRSLLSIDWILSQTQGLYIVVTDLHAFSVDVQRQLVFDCAHPLSFRLCHESLEFCLDGDTICAIRKIRLPKYLLPRS